MLDVNYIHLLFRCLVNGCIEPVNDVPIVLGDIILYIDDNKGFMVHVIFLCVYLFSFVVSIQSDVASPLPFVLY